MVKEAILELKTAAEERYYSQDFVTAHALALKALKRVELGDLDMHPQEKKELSALRDACIQRLSSSK